jgi:hypothetical protein
MVKLIRSFLNIIVGERKKIEINSETLTEITQTGRVIEERLHKLNEYFRENRLRLPEDDSNRMASSDDA